MIDTSLKIITNMWPTLAIFTIVIVTMRLFYLKLNKKEFVFYQEILSLLFLLYLLILFELVTTSELKGGGVNLVPFTEILRYSLSSKSFLTNVIGNIVVFIPFGYFVSAYIKAKKIGSITIMTIITSLSIELIQLNIGRSFDIDDIILNLAGGILGFLLYIGLSAIKKHLPGLFQKDFLYNIICLLIIIAIILYFLGIINFGWLL